MLRDIIRKTPEELKSFVISEMESMTRNYIVEDGFVYSEGSIPVMLVSHLDTVHTDYDKIICTDETGTILMSPEGIGGDDRCGVYALLTIAKELDVHLLFTEDEEVGCVGAGKFVKSGIKPDVNFIIEIDRKGDNDSVFYNCDNSDFEEFINTFGFKTANGSCSDISKIAPYLGVAAVNLSSGYYNAHTLHEFIDTEILECTIDRTKQIILNGDTKYEYIEKKVVYKTPTIGFTGKSYLSSDLCYHDYDYFGLSDWGSSPKKSSDSSFETWYNVSSYEVDIAKAGYYYTADVMKIPKKALIVTTFGTIPPDGQYMDKVGNIYYKNAELGFIRSSDSADVVDIVNKKGRRITFDTSKAVEVEYIEEDDIDSFYSELEYFESFNEPKSYYPEDSFAL